MGHFVPRSVASRLPDRPNSTTFFQIERNPHVFPSRGSAANTGDGPRGAVELRLPKRSDKPIDAGVAENPERVGAILHGAPIGEDQDWWGNELSEHVTHDGFRGRRDEKK